MTFNFKYKLMALGAVTAFGAYAILPSIAAEKTATEAATFTDAQKEAMAPIIKDFLMENPVVIMEAVQKYQEDEAMRAQQNTEEKIASNIKALTNGDAPTIGNAEADITVVEFFDYNCGYCKRALPDIQAVVEDDKNVKVVFQEMPILGPTSRTAALWALAAHNQDKYFDYHAALMKHQGAKTDAELEKIAKNLSLDVEKMKKDVESDALNKHLDDGMKIIRDIGVSGTPAFIVGTTFIPGYVGEDGLKQAIASERAKMKESNSQDDAKNKKKDG